MTDESKSSGAAVEACPACGRRNRVPASAAGVPRCGQCRSPLPWIATADDASYPSVAGTAPVPVLIDLWATWCGPCRAVSPVLEALARAYAGKLKLVKVDVDRSPRTAARHGVQGVPTLLVVDRGEVIARHVGAAPEHVLRPWLEDALAQADQPRS